MPSIVRWMSSGCFCSSGIVSYLYMLGDMRADFTLSVLDVILIFVAEELDAASEHARGGIAERAEGFAADVIADVEQQINISLAPLTMFEPVQDLGHPIGAFAAGRAFATRFVAIELD